LDIKKILLASRATCHSSCINCRLRINKNFVFEEGEAASTEEAATISSVSVDQLNMAPLGKGLNNSSSSCFHDISKLL
jgi:hypothetical protein